MATIIHQIVSKISEWACNAIFRQLEYLVHYEDNVQDLEKQKDELGTTRMKVDGLVAEATRRAEDVKGEVQKWLTRVNDIIEKAQELLTNMDAESQKNCFNGSCFNWNKRYQLSRKAKKMVNDIAEMIQKGEKFDKVYVPPCLPGIEHNSYYVDFESRMSIMEEIKGALKDPNINMIGVHGMGGIGKTILVEEISRQLKESKLFEPVIMAIVGQNPDVKHIQGQLADILRLPFDQETEQGRAALLRKRLQTEKKILLVLDDIWDNLDLKRVGVPSRDDYKGVKILVTCRSKDVLSNKMDVEKNFEVKGLTEKESWEFFKNMVDESVETKPELNEIAMKVANKCGKLPIALATVAKALKGRPLQKVYLLQKKFF